jgi:hypothetical protein
MSKARKSTARHSPWHNSHKPRSRAGTAAIGDSARESGTEIAERGRATGSSQGKAQGSRSKQQAAEGGGAKAKAAASTQEEAQGSRSKQQEAKATSKQAAKATGSQQGKGIYVYGILPADIEVAVEMPGVGESPGLLRVVRSDGLAALISEVDLSGRLGSPG